MSIADQALTEEMASRRDMIVCRGVKKWFGDFQALAGVDITVKDREVMVVLGPSGSGKSTLIRCINRLEVHQEGEIIVDGGQSSAKSCDLLLEGFEVGRKIVREPVELGTGTTLPAQRGDTVELALERKKVLDAFYDDPVSLQVAPDVIEPEHHALVILGESPDLAVSRHGL